ncbi:MAG: SPFH domain-containing protein [Flavobacteriales bacterium]|nr:SPFH domain-containing protein [Flavobacteriales bacterium]
MIPTEMYGGLIGAIFVIFLIFKSIVITKQKEAKLIERLGKFNSIRKPGLSFLIPFIDKVAYTQDLRINELAVDIETITKDKVSVHIRVAVQYYIKDNDDSIKNSAYELSDFRHQIRSYVFDEIRAEVPRKELDEVFENKETIEKAVKTGLSDAIEKYGFIIQNALVVDIDPDPNVKDAMNRINAATRDKIAAAEEGEAAKIRKVKAAEAEAESKRLQGQGIADQRNAIIKGFEESIMAFGKNTNIDQKEIMNFVILTQYYDTMREMAKDNPNVIFMPHSPDGQGLTSHLMAAEMGTEMVKKNTDKDNI